PAQGLGEGAAGREGRLPAAADEAWPGHRIERGSIQTLPAQAVAPAVRVPGGRVGGVYLRAARCVDEDAEVSGRPARSRNFWRTPLTPAAAASTSMSNRAGRSDLRGRRRLRHT